MILLSLPEPLALSGESERQGLPTQPSSGRPDCPVCGAGAWSAPLGPTRLLACRQCSTILHDRSASREEEERRHDEYNTEAALDEPVIAARQWRWVKGCLLLPEGITAPAVLDVGCGHGAFLRAVRSDGCRIAGVELSPAGAESCRRQGLPVREGSIFDVGLPNGPWDVITLWDVLEHLEDPREAMRLILAELAPGGHVVVRGRNARFHAGFAVSYAKVRGIVSRLGVPDMSVVHRWGLSCAGYAALMRDAGLQGIQLYAAAPTPGDRYLTWGHPLLVRLLKATIRCAGNVLFRASSHRLYPFPSVLISGRKPFPPSPTRSCELPVTELTRFHGCEAH